MKPKKNKLTKIELVRREVFSEKTFKKFQKDQTSKDFLVFERNNIKPRNQPGERQQRQLEL